MVYAKGERRAADLSGRAKVAFINVDERPELAGMFEVSSIPTLMLVKNA